MTQLDTSLLEQADPSTTRRTALKGALGLGVGGSLALAAATNANAVSADFGTWMTVVARQKMGARYVWGSQGPSTFDCAGLVRWSYHELTGTWLPVGTYQQFTSSKIGMRSGLKSLSTCGGSLKVGDPMFFWNGSSVGHVGLYLAGGNVLSASSGAGQVCIKSATSFNSTYRGVYCGYWR